jgi:predicted ATPase
LDASERRKPILEKAEAFVERTDERFWHAEVHRLRGECLQADAELAVVERSTSAEESYLAAIQVAGRQGARSLELRAVMSLARLWNKHGRFGDARLLLQTTHAWFTEGFDTVDLQRTAALLAELDAEPAASVSRR